MRLRRKLRASLPQAGGVGCGKPGAVTLRYAGEVVVDYDLRLQEMFGHERLWVRGYSNDVFAYIPSERVLKEGGYEGGGAMIYYVQPGPWAPSVESTIISATERLVQSLAAPGAGK